MSHRPICGRQTKLGGRAEENASGFAPCRLPANHREEECDSGPAMPPKAA